MGCPPVRYTQSSIGAFANPRHWSSDGGWRGGGGLVQCAGQRFREGSMDKIAVISDIHGNMPALEVVLADIKARGIDLIFNLGDLGGKGARSDLSIDRCREVCQVILRGNWDDFFVHK